MAPLPSTLLTPARWTPTTPNTTARCTSAIGGRARREAAILREVGRLLGPGGSHNILDVGCGDGLLFDKLAPYGHVEGVEVDPLTVSADGPWRQRIHIGPFDESYRPERQFDLILMLDVLEHLPKPAAALQHAASLLSRDGVVLVTVPAFRAVDQPRRS